MLTGRCGTRSIPRSDRAAIPRRVDQRRAERKACAQRFFFISCGMPSLAETRYSSLSDPVPAWVVARVRGQYLCHSLAHAVAAFFLPQITRPLQPWRTNQHDRSCAAASCLGGQSAATARRPASTGAFPFANTGEGSTPSTDKTLSTKGFIPIQRHPFRSYSEPCTTERSGPSAAVSAGTVAIDFFGSLAWARLTLYAFGHSQPHCGLLERCQRS